MSEKVVGLLIGRENTFPGPFIETVNRKGASKGVRAEMATMGGAREIEPQRYAVIVDRISHEVPYYRAHLKSAVLQGTVVVNDPFWWEADEKFFECTLARELGVAVPKTVVLPNKSYIPGIANGDLRATRLCPPMVPRLSRLPVVGHIPHARLTIIPDCWHLPNVDKPDEFNDLLLDFFTKSNQ